MHSRNPPCHENEGSPALEAPARKLIPAEWSLCHGVFVLMRICSPVVLSYLDTGLELRTGLKRLWIACLLLLLVAAATC